MSTVNSGETIDSAGTYELSVGTGMIQIGVATAGTPNPPFTAIIDQVTSSGGTVAIGNDDVVFQQLGTGAVTIDDGYPGNTPPNGFVLGGGGTVEIAATATVVSGDTINMDVSTLQVDGFAAGQLDNLVIGNLYDAGDSLRLEATHGVSLKSDGNSGVGTKFELDNSLGVSLGTFVVGHTNLSTSLFTVSYDAATNTTIINGNLCVLRGTRVATPDGEVAVEDLAVGDLVRTASGRTRPIVWIGSRTHDIADVVRDDMLLPVRIAAGAIAANMPVRDLRVSPDHAILLDGKLIPARLLLNGSSVVQERMASFEYFHVELDAHDAMVADGLAVESFLNVGAAREAFVNRAVAVLRIEATQAAVREAYAARAFAPLVTDAAVVEPIWRAIAARCDAIAAAAETERSGLPTIVADGRRLAPVSVDGGRLTFVLPSGVSSLRLQSAAAVPARTQPWLDDRRMLGVAVSGVRVRDAGGVSDLPLGSDHFGRGWWAIEGEGENVFRWTDGAGVIALAGACASGGEIEIAVRALAPVARIARSPALSERAVAAI